MDLLPVAKSFETYFQDLFENGPQRIWDFAAWFWTRFGNFRCTVGFGGNFHRMDRTVDLSLSGLSWLDHYIINAGTDPIYVKGTPTSWLSQQHS